MVYNQKLVVVVKCNGKVLRERGDVVTLPFGSEYSLLVKNLNSRSASVKISIDGKDTLYGNHLIVDPNSETELTGFMQGSTVRNRFKFIQKTKEIQDHRGDRSDDGIIRVEFAFEKRKPEVVTTTRKVITEHHHSHHCHPGCGCCKCRPRIRWYYYDYNPPLFGDGLTWNSDGVSYGSGSTGGLGEAQSTYTASMGTPTPNESVGMSNVEVSCDAPRAMMSQVENLSVPNADEGITVEGSKTYQDFHYASIGALEQSEVIILRLRGIQGDGAKVCKPLTVKTKLECPTCGKKSSSGAKFCAQCGTNLECSC